MSKKKIVRLTARDIRQLINETLGLDASEEAPVKPNDVVDPIAVSTDPYDHDSIPSNAMELKLRIDRALLQVPDARADEVYKKIIDLINKEIGDNL